jgi:asparagine N-glycosylation enzyme membrane subunit Stt3
MTPAHFHLMLNHIPVLGGLGGFLLLAWARWKKSADVEHVALITLIIVALFAIPVYLTGGPAEDSLEGLPQLSEQFIEPHEQLALYALIGAIIVGALALYVWYQRKRKASNAAMLVTVLLGLSLIQTALVAWTAWEGGKINHVELRAGYIAPAGGEETEDKD